MTNSTMEDRDILRDTARRFLSEGAPVAQLRRLRDTRDEAGFSTALWSNFSEMGYTGMLVPEEFGGSGLGLSEAVLVMEQIGHTLCASPFLATGVVAVTALLHAGTQAQQAHWLPCLAKGKSIVTLAVDERAKHGPEHIETHATRDGGGWRLNGAKCFVVDGHIADLLIVAARTSGSTMDRHGISLFLVPRTACGVTVDRTIMVDSHNSARVTLQNAEVSSDMLLGTLDGGAQTLDAALTSGRVAAAAELLGIADEVFERTIGYLKERRQFDRPIGEFQGLQHRAAKLYIEIELSRAALLDAVQKLDSTPGVIASHAVAVAKAKCGNTAILAVQEGIQMHGGIAMTDEFEIGFFLKRARVLHELFGDANFHMNRLALLGQY